MIKINLLPQKRARRAAALAAEPGSRDFFLGIGAIVAAAAVVFFVVDKPKRDRLDDLATQSKNLDDSILGKTKKLKEAPGYEQLKKLADEAEKRVASINKLNSVRVVPANLLHELGEILTQGHQPAMTEDMARKTGNGADSDPNKRFDPQWDPSHVWLTSFVDNNGEYKIEGGAQAEVDVTQLTKRLAASVYFGPEIAVPEQHRETEKESGISFFKFTITGKVAY
jgi:hypothetical protein